MIYPLNLSLVSTQYIWINTFLTIMLTTDCIADIARSVILMYNEINYLLGRKTRRGKMTDMEKQKVVNKWNAIQEKINETNKLKKLMDEKSCDHSNEKNTYIHDLCN